MSSYGDDDGRGVTNNGYNNNNNDDDDYVDGDERHLQQQQPHHDHNQPAMKGEVVEQQDGEIHQLEQDPAMATTSSSSIEPSRDPYNESSLVLRPLFFGNLIPNYSPDQITTLFEQPYKIDTLPDKDTAQPIYVDRIDIKRGYCFVFFKDATSLEDKRRIESFCMAINRINVEGVSRAIRAEFARGDGRVKKIEDERRKNIAPSETLFVVNFNEMTTKKEDLELLFEPFGKLIRIDLKRNYAFVQYSTIAEATAAKEATNGGKLDQSVLTVEYVARQQKRDGGGSHSDNRNRNNNNNSSSDRNRLDSRRDRRMDDRGGRSRYNDPVPSSSNRYSDPPSYDDRGGRNGGGTGRISDSYDRGRSEYRDRGISEQPAVYRPTIYDNDRYSDRRASRDSPPPIPPYHRRSGRSRSRSPPSYRSRYPDDDRGLSQANDYRSSTSGGGGGQYNDRHAAGGGRSTGSRSPPPVGRGTYDRDHRGYRG